MPLIDINLNNPLLSKKPATFETFPGTDWSDALMGLGPVPVDEAWEIVLALAVSRSNVGNATIWVVKNRADLSFADLAGGSTDELPGSPVPYGQSVALTKSRNAWLAPEESVAAKASVANSICLWLHVMRYKVESA
jgi:hypothetical protein